MNIVTDFDISKILNTLERRKGLVVSVFVVVASLAIYLATVLPNVYQSNCTHPCHPAARAYVFCCVHRNH